METLPPGLFRAIISPLSSHSRLQLALVSKKCLQLVNKCWQHIAIRDGTKSTVDLGRYKHLKELVVIDYPMLTKLNVGSVKKLTLERCPKIKQLTCISTELTELNIIDCDMLIKLYLNDQIQKLHISDCIKLSRVDHYPRALQQLKLRGESSRVILSFAYSHLEQLTLSCCTTDLHLTQIHPNLRTLIIDGCKTPTTFIVPATVKELEITGCHNLVNLDEGKAKLDRLYASMCRNLRSVCFSHHPKRSVSKIEVMSYPPVQELVLPLNVEHLSWGPYPALRKLGLSNGAMLPIWTDLKTAYWDAAITDGTLDTRIEPPKNQAN